MADRRIMGLRSDHEKEPVFAQERGGRLLFTALIRNNSSPGLVVRVDAPVLTALEVRQWVKARLEAFLSSPWAQESPELAVRRKVVAAQGIITVGRARADMPKPEQSEMARMLSKDSHTQALPFDDGEGKPVVTVHSSGEVEGLDDDGRDHLTPESVRG